MDHRSLWQKTSPPPSEFPSLEHDLTCEVAVVGAGLTGVLTAHALRNQGIDVVLLEAGTPGHGATGYTTAKITAQHGPCYAKLISSHGVDAAKQYVRANLDAVETYADLIRTQNMDCDFQWTDCVLYARSSLSQIRTERDALKAVGLEVQFTRETQLPFPVAGALKLPDQAVFHPLKFLHALLPALRVYTNTTVQKLCEDGVETNRGFVRAKHIVIATRFPFFLLPGLYFARMHQERSYAVSVSGVPSMSEMYIDAEGTGVTFRPWQEQIVLGGAGHRSGRVPTQTGYDTLARDAKHWYPGSQITAQWSTEDAMPADLIPYIGRYDQKQSKVYVAAGFQKWGMTTAMVAARVLTDLICRRKNEFAALFSPHRIPHGKAIGTILSDGGISAGNLLKQAFYIPRTRLQQIRPGQGGIVQWKGHKAGVYHHENGRYYLVSTRCTHMGCQLVWNPAERSWDCPCHGSRFSYDGTRLDPPAAKDLPCKQLEK